MFVGLRNFLLLAVCLVFGAAQAWAVALGKIEVTSHLGETFYAEAPLQLDAGEKISDVSVELAASSDYQILEVFRDPSINQLQVDIKNDLRGPRAVISSSDAVDTPYFNLVLKLRHGHATNFKKFPVFLDLPEQVQPAPTLAPAPIAQAPAAPVEPLVEAQPSVSAVSIRPTSATTVEVSREQDAAGSQAVVEAEPVGEPTGSQYEPFEGWSRTSRYGPMVRGDTLTTVARRLPVDERYTLNQIMVGLYNKNKSKFRENNINLINAGTYLQVPTAADVEAVTDRQAKQVITEHEKRWKDLKSQPVYAAEAEAQENRYRPRVQIGREASGVASAPIAPNAPQTMPVQQNQQPVATQGMAPGGVQGTTDSMLGLQQENLRLKQALQESEQRASSAKPATADALAAEEKVKKLELTVARLQSQLVQMNQQIQAAQSQGMNTLTYTLMAVVLLLLLVAAYLLFRLRRDRSHPAMDRAAAEAATAAAAGGAAVALAEGVDDGDVVPEEATDDADMDSTAFAESLDAGTDDETASDSDADLLFADQTPAVAQSGVDYLAEADVYLRYGMEDEALQQLNLALEQNPDQPEAHS
ncbi:MAG: FimV/HubP family polar landmark protein, partial [Mariprofundaceae bacterium]|nr:FimV/HubP family polar landmark protein [Mariprofundaceae bacterium]